MKCFISSLFTAACLACFARDMPISNGRLVNALNANQQMITNLPSAFWEGHGGGGTSTNAVQAIIEKNVETNYLCTVAAAQAMTNGKADKATTIGGYGITDAIRNTPLLESLFGVVWNGNYLWFQAELGILLNSWDYLCSGGLGSQQTLPQYLSSGDWNTASDPFAKLSDIPTPDFTTNNAALVSTITNLAPSKARGISLADPVRHCNWYQCVTNGVFFWLVED